METQAQYETREIQLFHKQIQEINKSPLQDRREAKKELKDLILSHTDFFIEQMEWLTNGSYGYGAMVCWQRLTKNMNRHAWLFINAAMVEHGVSNKDARDIWKALPETIQAKINQAIDELITEETEE